MQLLTSTCRHLRTFHCYSISGVAKFQHTHQREIVWALAHRFARSAKPARAPPGSGFSRQQWAIAPVGAGSLATAAINALWRLNASKRKDPALTGSLGVVKSQACYVLSGSVFWARPQLVASCNSRPTTRPFARGENVPPPKELGSWVSPPNCTSLRRFFP